MEATEARRGYARVAAWDEGNLIQAMASLKNCEKPNDRVEIWGWMIHVIYNIYEIYGMPPGHWRPEGVLVGLLRV